MVYPKTTKYVLSLCCVHKRLFDECRETNDTKLYAITVILLKYIKKACDELGIDTRTLTPTEKIDVAPIYGYIRDNRIQLYDLTSMIDGDMDHLNDSHIERFILSHIHYIFKRNEILV